MALPMAISDTDRHSVKYDISLILEIKKCCRTYLEFLLIHNIWNFYTAYTGITQDNSLGKNENATHLFSASQSS